MESISKKTFKKINIFLLVFVLATYLVGLSACSAAALTFDFNYEGGGTEKRKIYFDKEIAYPELTREGYTFGGWYLDKECTVPFEVTFLDYILGNTVYAKWTKTTVSDVTEGNISVHFLELGNIYTGDCVYIKAGDVDILIDAGSKTGSGATITNYLSDYVTDGKLEYVIATHAHEDHLAAFYGANGVFAKFKTDLIIEFALTNKTNVSSNTVIGKYYAARNSEKDDGATCYTAAQCFNEEDGAQRVYQVNDNTTLEIMYNYYYFNMQAKSASENNYSVCVMLRQGENNYLFTGDLESAGEKKMVEYYENQNNPLPHCLLYKAGHHGSETSTTEELMAAITPEIVCVCCCAGTSEYTSDSLTQFPTQSFVNNVAPYTDKVYVTTMVDNYVSEKWSTYGTVKSMNGNIVVSCTDGVVSVNCSNNNTLLKDTVWFKNNRTLPSAWK